MKYFRITQRQVLFAMLLLINGCNTTQIVRGYLGKPFFDVKYTSGAQVIPGRIQCEYFDSGGEGIAYHDNDSINSGSGKLNPANGSYLNEFRIREHVDISYTKARNIDNNDFNLVRPEMDQLYVGWTNPGEWTKYTVDVRTPGLFRVGIMYTANDDGQIALSINDKDVTGPLNIKSTYAAGDTIKWRQWHHWNYLDNIAEVELKKGLQILTLHTVARGQMNYDYLKFSRLE